MPFPTRTEYEALVYNLPAMYSEIESSTLRLYSTSALTAFLEGELHFKNGLTLRVAEVIDYKNQRLQKYGYTILRGQEKLRWYDPQSHPENPALVETFPHHFHEPPDIKHNRRPAEHIRFDSPNLSNLIQACIELEQTLAK